MQPFRLMAPAAALLVLATGLPADAQNPDSIVLPVTIPDGLAEQCQATVDAETPLEREARVAAALAYVRDVRPGLDDVIAAAAAERLVAERCQTPDVPPPPARLEMLGGRQVVHFGEHSIVHDLYHGGGTSGVPMHLVFFGVPAANGGSTVRNIIDSSGWQEPPDHCEGGNKKTHLYDARHGGSDTGLVDNTYHMQKDEDECMLDERHHVRLWPSQTGDTHPGSTRGGYVLGSAHYETIDWYWDNGCYCPHHDPQCYDCARNYLANDVLASGVVDVVYQVQANNFAPKGTADGRIYYLHMRTPDFLISPCDANSVVRVFEHTGYLGECRALSFSDADFAGDHFNNNVLWFNDAASSVIVASGYKAVFYEHANFAGASRTSRCSDNQFVAGGFNDRASSVRIEKAHAANCYVTFSGARGTSTWAQVNVATSWSPVAVHARINEGGWIAMAKQATGPWGVSTSIPAGAKVQFRATVGTGGGADLSPCYQWIPPANTDASTVYCANPFKASFSGVSGNDWWVQANVASNQPLGAVEYRVACAPYFEPSSWKPLAKQGWGGWAASPSSPIPSGAKLDFRARSTGVTDGAAWTSTEFDLSGGYTWPTATPTTGC